MTQAKALLLDAMGTLIGLRQSVGTLYSAAAADYGLDLEAEALDRAFAQAYSQAPPLAFPGVAPAHLAQAERSWWQQRIEATVKAVGVKQLPIGLAGELFDRFAQPEPWAVYAEVPDALERWRQSGLALMVVSNFDRRLHGLLERLGLRLKATLDRLQPLADQLDVVGPVARDCVSLGQRLGIRVTGTWHQGDWDVASG